MIDFFASIRPGGELARALRKAAPVTEVTMVISTCGGHPNRGGQTQANVSKEPTMTVRHIEIQRFLKGVDYSASNSASLRIAGREGVGEDVRATLQRMPDEAFESPADVNEALDKID